MNYNIIRSYFKFKAKNKTPLAFVKVFGCQQNEADADVLRSFFINFNFNFTDDINNADFIILNTCAVRHSAENRVLGFIGELKKIKNKNTKSFICVCGCMTEQLHMKNRILTHYPYIDLVFGTDYKNFDKFLYEKILELWQKDMPYSEDVDQLQENFVNIKARKNNFKAFVPIISGCNNFCSYCIVPYVRGREKSRDSKEIIKEIKSLIDNGYKDITLLGQNVNSYGKDLNSDYNFSKLLYEIDKIEGNWRLRFMTSHPKDFSFELIDMIKEIKHFCKHIHLPFQSGSDKILKSMNRGYTKEIYLGIIENIKNKIPDIFITSDVIIGFPGETYEDFNDTLDIIKKVEFTSLFTFIYSPRKNTPAEKLDNNLTKEEISSRMKTLTELQRKITKKIETGLIGKEIEVLVENKLDDLLITRAKNNLMIYVKDKYFDYELGEFINVIPKSINYGSLFC